MDLAEAEQIPSEWPRIIGRPADKPVVYYRITKLKGSASDEALADVLREHLDEPSKTHAALVTPKTAHPEILAHAALDLDVLRQLREIQIRYLFYYPNELGSGSHLHDLESIELRLVVELADETGDPHAQYKTCRQIRVATVYGAAHGLGLFTNVLDLNDVLGDRLEDRRTLLQSRNAMSRLATDPVWPLVILVEEGKHASAPDRNADGVFTPGYDVNRSSADAWGVRDTMRSKFLAPAFRADTFKQRIPAIWIEKIQGNDEFLPHPVDSENSKAEEAFSRYVRYQYDLRRATSETEVCGETSPPTSLKERRRALDDYARDLVQKLGTGNPEDLLSGKDFCGDTNIQARFNGVDFFRTIGAGGEYNGYTRFWERISASLRFDGGFGWTGTVPIPIPVPLFGGVVVSRLSGAWCCRAARKSIDVLYMPSASRFADWYFGGGNDWGEVSTESVQESGQRAALEFGTKFRFPVPKLGTFFGARVGVRANINRARTLENARVVLEVGAGIW